MSSEYVVLLSYSLLVELKSSTQHNEPYPESIQSNWHPHNQIIHDPFHYFHHLCPSDQKSQN
jgi:hypothetical protein